MAEARYVAHEAYVPPEGAEAALARFRSVLERRRSVRQFRPDPVPRAWIEEILRCACSAPSGANKQPWHFVAVSDPELKRRIRLAAEEEERRFYSERASEEWLRDLEPLGTDADKGFLEVAPWLVVMFKQVRPQGGGKHYYVDESCGIAAGMLLAAAQEAGLATLTHTPSPMGFLGELLGRPRGERAFLLVPMGLPAEELRVPELACQRKPMDEVVDWRD
jgi:iodotyrosine deiodinase